MAGPNYNAPGKFPGPYVNTTKADDPMMERVPFETMDIGARRSGLPKGDEVTSKIMGITHVGNTATGKG